jgi:hypothetical protein
MGNKQHIDELLDAALAGTFPASDPVSALHATRRPPGSEGEEETDEQDVGQQAVEEPGRDEGRGRRPR